MEPLPSLLPKSGSGAVLEPHSKCDSAGPERYIYIIAWRNGLGALSGFRCYDAGFGSGLQVQDLS